MNNLNEIRKLAGYTQEEIAQLLSVSRVTISKMENDEDYNFSKKHLEKLSLLFNISPDYIKEKPLCEKAREIITEIGKRAKQREKVEGTSQADVVNKLTEISPIQAMKSYMISTKVLLVKADELSIEQFEDIIKVNTKLGLRLENILKEKRKETEMNITEEINTLMEKYEE